MKLHFLGTGTSFGIPVIGCDCGVCRSEDPRDRRTRHGALLENDDGSGRLLVDTPPELRLQAVRAGIDAIDAVWFTHGHADHTHGIDDLRAFSARGRGVVRGLASEECARMLRDRFEYVFDPSAPKERGTSRPEVELEILQAGRAVEVAGMQLTPLEVPHGRLRPLGFRVGDLGYVTDAKSLPDRTLETLRGVRVLVLNALWFGRPHPTHFNVEEAVAAAESVGAEQTWLTHITHRVGHVELEEALPDGIRPASDGLRVEI